MNGFTFWIALGLLGFGLMTVVFLLKFIFSIKREDMTGLVEITEAEEPQVFQFIHQVAHDTRAPLPKKIYLSHQVNAAVFYHSSFWSMFLPVRKNLVIGLGLVNALSISELKAVLAHEFGHFSQRSMKLGSYVYQSNRVIYNLLYENESWGHVLEKLSSWNSILSAFALLSVWMANQIIKILQFFYVSLNKKQMRLSREMEFHADTVAASVAGSDQTIHALRRVELADYAFNEAIDQCNRFIADQEKVQNFYQCQRAVLTFVGLKNKLALVNELPVVDDSYLASFPTSRINFKDQWASHPSQFDREIHLRKVNITATQVDASAWLLFEKVEKWQQLFTDQLYQSVTFENGSTSVTAEAFLEKYEASQEEYQLPAVFRGYYTNRIIQPFDLDNKIPSVTQTWDELFTEEVINLNEALQSNRRDLQVLQAIESGEIDVSSFDFDGKKYKRAGAQAWAVQLSKEIEKQIEKINLTDQAIYWYFQANVSVEAEVLKKQYEALFQSSALRETFAGKAEKLLSALRPFFEIHSEEQTTLTMMYREFKQTEEPEFRQTLVDLLEQKRFEETFAGSLKSRVEAYVGQVLADDLNGETLMEMYHLQNDVQNYLAQWEFYTQKRALQLQAQGLQEEISI